MTNGALIDAAIIIIVIAVIAVSIIGLIAFWRFRKSYRLTIEKDYRNPQAARKTFYAMYSPKLKYYELFSNILAFKAERGLANVDLKAFANRKGEVTAIRSPTGKPGDDMIVPIGLPITGQAEAQERADRISNGVMKILQEAGIAYEKLKELNKLGTLTDAEVQKMFSQATIQRFKSAFTSKWLLQEVGLNQIQDAAIITIPQKNAIASLNTRANEFVIDHTGWWEQHGGLIVGITTLIFVAVGVSIMMYGAQSYLTHLGASIPGIVQASYNASAHTNPLNIYGVNLTKSVPGGT